MKHRSLSILAAITLFVLSFQINHAQQLKLKQTLGWDTGDPWLNLTLTQTMDEFALRKNLLAHEQERYQKLDTQSRWTDWSTFNHNLLIPEAKAEEQVLFYQSLNCPKSGKPCKPERKKWERFPVFPTTFWGEGIAVDSPINLESIVITPGTKWTLRSRDDKIAIYKFTVPANFSRYRLVNGVSQKGQHFYPELRGEVIFTIATRELVYLEFTCANVPQSAWITSEQTRVWYSRQTVNGMADKLLLPSHARYEGSRRGNSKSLFWVAADLDYKKWSLYETDVAVSFETGGKISTTEGLTPTPKTAPKQTETSEAFFARVVDPTDFFATPDGIMRKVVRPSKPTISPETVQKRSDRHSFGVKVAGGGYGSGTIFHYLGTRQEENKAWHVYAFLTAWHVANKKNPYAIHPRYDVRFKLTNPTRIGGEHSDRAIMILWSKHPMDVESVLPFSDAGYRELLLSTGYGDNVRASFKGQVLSNNGSYSLCEGKLDKNNECEDWAEARPAVTAQIPTSGGASGSSGFSLIDGSICVLFPFGADTKEKNNRSYYRMGYPGKETERFAYDALRKLGYNVYPQSSHQEHIVRKE